MLEMEFYTFDSIIQKNVSYTRKLRRYAKNPRGTAVFLSYPPSEVALIKRMVARSSLAEIKRDLKNTLL